jgi:putative serine protease PepD
MTDNQHGPAQGEPTEPRQQAEAAPEVAAAAETASPAPATPVASTPAPAAEAAGAPAPAAAPTAVAPTAAAPATPAAHSATQTAPTAPVAAAAPQAQAPAAPTAPTAPTPTGTVYTPGQTPQPYHAAQYSHQPAAHVAPATQYPAQQPGYSGAQTAPAAGHQPGHPTAAANQAPHTQTQPTQPLPGSHGSVPPAFGGPSGPGGPGTPNGAAQDTPSGQPKQRRVGLGVAAAIVAAALIGGASGAGITALVGGDRSPGTVESSATGTQNIVVNDTESVNEITAVAAKASPSVVTISVAGGQGAGTGSGIVISEDGYVITNTHVVTLDGTTGEPTIQVKASDGRLYTADLIGTDPMSDLAVIKLREASGLQALEFADSDALNVGDAAIAIGAPLGLSGTVTNGIVSALNRSIDVKSSAVPESPEDSREGESQQPFDFWNFDIPGQEGGQQTQSGGTISIPVIQTDAAINPGNSGGALLDSQGRIIGVNVAILSAGGASGQAGNIGVGFAVPANLAERVAGELIEDGSASHGLLGATVTSAQAEAEAKNVGALITDVTPGGAAASAGLQAGDVVTELNGIQITDQTDLTAQVRAQAGGAKTQLTYIRNGESTTLDVTLGTYEG